MFKKKGAGRDSRLPDILKGFQGRHETDARIHHPTRSADALVNLADAASDSSKAEGERCDALSAICESVCLFEADIQTIAPRLTALLEQSPENMASLASRALAAFFLDKGDYPALLTLSSHPRFPVRSGAISETEAFLIVRGYDSRMGPVFAGVMLEDDPDIRRACRVAFREGASAGDVMAAKLLAAAAARERQGRLDS